MAYDLIDMDYYKGPPKNRGVVVESPGGLENAYHGMTQGPYSQSATQSNVFGNSLPPSLHQPRGNLYGKGEGYYGGAPLGSAPGIPLARMGQSGQPIYENFELESGQNYDIIPDDGIEEDMPKRKKKSKENYTAMDGTKLTLGTEVPKDTLSFFFQVFILLILVIILFFVADLWGKFALNIIREYVFKGHPLRTWNFGTIALAGTVVFIVIIWVVGFPFLSTQVAPTPTPPPFR